MNDTRSAAHQTAAARMGLRPAYKAPLRITRGRKLGGGGVIGKDRLWIAHNGADEAGICQLADDYAAFNADPELSMPPAAPRGENPQEWADRRRAAIEAHRPSRRTLWLTLTAGPWVAEHAADDPRIVTAPGCVEMQLRKQTDARQGGPRGKQTPTGAPWCSSYDGRWAQRWDGKQFVRIACPAGRCEFREEGLDAQTACQRRVRLTAQLRWPDGPCPACKGTGLSRGGPCPACAGARTFSWGLPEQGVVIDAGGPFGFAADFFEGFYAEVAEQWAAVAATLNADAGAPNFYGLPVRLTLTRWTSRVARREQWLPRLYPDLPPGMTLQAWAAARVAQAEQARPLIEGRWTEPLALSGPTTDAEWEPAGTLNRPSGDVRDV